MLKAKAKAAATAARQKKMAAEAAAAAAAAAAESPRPAAGSRSGATSGRPLPTQYWADSASSQLAPGGGIQRIGYDHAKFEAAIKKVVLREGEPEPTKVDESKLLGGEEVKEEDVQVLVTELDLKLDEAKKLLASVGGELSKALDRATEPVLQLNPSGVDASQLVKV